MGKCDVCHTENVSLSRKYYHYNIKCECHSPNHAEFVSHCGNCVPVEPLETKLTVSTKTLKDSLKPNN